MTTPVIVAGAGLAGTVAALAMQRAGVDVEVYEAYDGPMADAGGLISLAVNGLRALRAIDCLDAVRAAGVTVPVMQAWSPRGRPVGQAPRHGSNRSDVPSMSFLRGPMIEALHAEAERSGIRVHLGKRLVDADAGAATDGVVARFEDGTTAESDVLVGADGAHSVARQLIDPDAPMPEYAGVYVLGGTAATPSELTGLARNTFHAMMTEHGLFAFVVLDDQAWWTAQIAQPEAPPVDELRTLSSVAGRDRLAAMYSSHAAALINATERFHTPTLMYRLAPVPTWRRDGILLVGDAAHLVDAGIGGSLAIEDGLMLAKCLRDVADRREALERFEQLRRPRIDPLVAFGAKHKKTKTPNPLVKRFTLATLPVLMPVFMKLAGTRFAGRMFEYDVDWETPLPLAPSK